MSTTWTPALDVQQGAAQQLAKVVDEMSGGRFRIEVFPGGQIMPRSPASTAPHRAPIQAFMGAPYYWAEKEPAAQWFATVPFGMNAEGMAAWYHHGDGLKLWEEIYAAFNLVPRPGPATGPADGRLVPEEDRHDRRLQGAQDAHPGPRRQGRRQGGRHRRPDAGGRDLRCPRAGRDRRLRVDRPARRHEARSPQDRAVLLLSGLARAGHHAEFGFNRKAYEALPVDLRRTLDHATAAVQVYGRTDYHAKNTIALERLKTEFKGKVELLQLPAPLLRDLKKLAAEVVKEESEKSPMATKVYASFTKFQAQHGPAGPTSRKAPTSSSWRVTEATHQQQCEENLERRRFIVKAGGALAAAGAAAVSTPPTSSPSRRSSGECPRP